MAECGVRPRIRVWVIGGPCRRLPIFRGSVWKAQIPEGSGPRGMRVPSRVSFLLRFRLTPFADVIPDEVVRALRVLLLAGFARSSAAVVTLGRVGLCSKRGKAVPDIRIR